MHSLPTDSQRQSDSSGFFSCFNYTKTGTKTATFTSIYHLLYNATLSHLVLWQLDISISDFLTTFHFILNSLSDVINYRMMCSLIKMLQH